MRARRRIPAGRLRSASVHPHQLGNFRVTRHKYLNVKRSPAKISVIPCCWGSGEFILRGMCVDRSRFLLRVFPAWFADRLLVRRALVRSMEKQDSLAVRTVAAWDCQIGIVDVKSVC